MKETSWWDAVPFIQFLRVLSPLDGPFFLLFLLLLLLSLARFVPLGQSLLKDLLDSLDVNGRAAIPSSPVLERQVVLESDPLFFLYLLLLVLDLDRGCGRDNRLQDLVLGSSMTVGTLVGSINDIVPELVFSAIDVDTL